MQKRKLTSECHRYTSQAEKSFSFGGIFPQQLKLLGQNKYQSSYPENS